MQQDIVQCSSPTYPQLVGFVVTSGNASGLLGLVDVGAFFAQVKVAMTSSGDALETEKRRMLVLPSQTALVAGEDGFDVQPTGGLDATRGLGLRGLLHGLNNFADFGHLRWF